MTGLEDAFVMAAALDPKQGKDVPSLTLESLNGAKHEKVSLPQALKGKWTVLYFYPKDDTPGCTQQACSYRDRIGDFKKIGVQVMGVSGDDLASHGAFTKKHQLNFPLLSDPQHKLSAALGVFNGGVMSRDTFLIDPQGKIRKVWRKVSPTNTMNETLEVVKAEMGKESGKQAS